MVDGDVAHGEAVLLDLRDQLDADQPGVACQLDRVEDALVNQAEVAVHVAALEAEGPLHQPVIEAADHDAVERIVTRDLVAVHQLRPVPGRPEQRKLGHVVLRVAVRVEDPLLAGRREARAQRAAVAAVRLVRDDAQVRHQLRQLFEHVRAVVGARVVHDHDLPVVGEPGERAGGENHLAGDRAPVVVGRKEGADAGLAHEIHRFGRKVREDSSVRSSTNGRLL